MKKLQITIIKEASLFTSRWKQFKKRGIPTITPLWLLKSPYKIFKSVIIEEKANERAIVTDSWQSSAWIEKHSCVIIPTTPKFNTVTELLKIYNLWNTSLFKIRMPTSDPISVSGQWAPYRLDLTYILLSYAGSPFSWRLLFHSLQWSTSVSQKSWNIKEEV